MEKEGTYNGYTNYETWAVALWMDNDQGSYAHYRELRSVRPSWQTTFRTRATANGRLSRLNLPHDSARNSRRHRPSPATQPFLPTL